jgi:hypothetical protein
LISHEILGLFQSAPGFSAGRNQFSDPSSCLLPEAAVSIRSRLFGREKRGDLTAQAERPEGAQFQSAPGFSAGRNAVQRRSGDTPSPKFQSAPGFSAGRNGPPMFEIAFSVPRHWVSIRSRLFGREKPADANDAERRAVCFNPLPAFRPGETSTTLAEVMPPAQFQSAPGFSAGRNVCRRGGFSAADRFQSAPGFSAGRNRHHQMPHSHRPCFNPLPAFRPGETETPSGGGCCGNSALFQSAPGFSAGRNSASATVGRQSEFVVCCANLPRQVCLRLG